MIDRLLRWTRNTLVIATLVIIAGVAILPETTTTSSNADDIEWRHLEPITSTTTTVHVATSAAPGELVIVDGDRVWRLPRTPLVARLLWMATTFAKDTE